MAKLVNRARMTTTSGGAGTFTLVAAVDGAQTFASAGVLDGETVSYAAENPNDPTKWEIGTGVYTASGTSLTRNVIAGSNGTSPVNFSAAPEVFVTALAEDFGQVKQISIRLSDTTTNVTPDAFTDLPLDGTVTGDTGDFTVNTTTDEITVSEGGWYRVTGVLQVTSTATRASMQAQILVNGTAIDGIYGSPYLRNGGSLDDGGLYILSPWIDLDDGDTITIQTRSGQANGKTGTLISGSASYIAIEQKGGVGPKGDVGPPGPAGDVGTSGTPSAGQFARFTDAATIEGRTAAQVRTDLSLRTAALVDTTAFATAAQGANADTAFGWGNHALAGYLTSVSLASLGVTATAAELNKLDGVYVSTAQINHLFGVTSPIQTQLNGKAATSHTHDIANVTGLQTALDGKAATSHTHTIANVTGLQTALDGKAASANPVFTGSITEAYLSETAPGASFSINPANGTLQYISLSAACTFTYGDLASGQAVLLAIQDASAYGLTWGSVYWVGGSPPTLAGSGAYTMVSIVKMGSLVIGVPMGDASL